MSMLLRTIVVAIAFMIGGCASSNLGVGFTLSDCCQPEALDYQSYEMTIVDSPEFLKPYILESMARALEEKGLIRDADQHDLLVILTLQQTDLKQELQKDEFEGHLSPGGDFHFNAAIHLEILDQRVSRVIWKGTISRNHSVLVGEYMHAARARRAIYEAISEILKDFPAVNNN